MLYVCQSVFEYENDTWFIDSWCSNHLTSDKFFLYRLMLERFHKLVEKTIMYSNQKGEINCYWDKKRKKFIKDVLVIPDLDQNLSYVRQVMDHGYAVRFVNNSCMIYEKENKKTSCGKCQDGENVNLFSHFGTKKMWSWKSKTLMSHIWLCQRRFWHFSFTRMKNLQQKIWHKVCQTNKQWRKYLKVGHWKTSSLVISKVECLKSKRIIGACLHICMWTDEYPIKWQ